MEKEKKEKKEEKKETTTPLIYLGPNLNKFGIINGQVYIGKSEIIKTALNEYPEAKTLFVIVDENLSLTKKQIRTPGTVENILFNKVKDKVNGGK